MPAQAIALAEKTTNGKIVQCVWVLTNALQPLSDADPPSLQNCAAVRDATHTGHSLANKAQRLSSPHQLMPAFAQPTFGEYPENHGPAT